MAFTSSILNTQIATGEVIIAGDQYVNSGGIANLMTIRASGNQFIYYGGNANSTTIYSGGAQFVAGAATMTIINSSGIQRVGDSGTATTTIINNGGVQLVFSNGMANSATINNGGYQEIADNAKASATIINSGGSQYVSANGTANVTTINSGGRQEIGYGGNAATAMINSGGAQRILAGGAATGVTINSGGVQFVDGRATTTVINSGGAQYVNSGGTASLSVVKSNGLLMVGAGGSAIGFNVSSGGIFGWDFNTVLSGKINGVAVTSSSGNSSFNLFLNGASQYVSTGETAEGTNVNSGGIQHVRRGGVANNAIVNSSGAQHVSSGGSANNTIINNGGVQEVYYYGTANDAIINNGGAQRVSSGGNVNNATVNNGGDLFVDDYGQVTGVLTVAGGHVTMTNASAVAGLTAIEYVLSGANANDTLITVNEGIAGSGAATYSLDLNDAVQGTYFLTESANLTGMTGKIFTIEYNDQTISLQVGSTYSFSNGNSIKLSIFDATIDRLLANVTGDFIAPSVPVTLTQHAAGAVATLDWADSTDSTSGMQGYSIEYATNNLFTDATAASSTASNVNLDFTGITGIATYYWHVKAQDNAGNWSDWSNASSFVVTPADIGANTWQTAKNISVLDNWVGLGDPADCYKLTMTSAGTLTLNLSGLSGDANLSLLDSKGMVLKTSVNKGNLSETITNYALLGGTYYVNVAPADAGKGGVNTNYTLTHNEIYSPTDIGANTWQAAKDIATLDNWVGFGDPADYYKLTMTGAGALTLNLTGLTGGDANLSLLDSKGKVLKTSSNKGTLSEAITNYALLGGTYYINVAPSDAGKGGVNTNYTLTHTENYFPADKAANTWQTATAIATLDNWVGLGDPADCYKLTMNKAGTLTLNLTGLTGDANLSLLDSKGKVLKTSVNKGNLNESIANFLLDGGTYYVNVAPATGVNSASYTLTHTENYFPTDLASNYWQAAKNITTLDNWVGYGDPADCYKLTMTAAGTITLNLTGLTGDANLSLLDSNGKELKTSANRGNTSESIANYLLLGGTYYVKVAPAANVNSATYTLTHTENYFPADKAANTWQTATAIATLDNWVGYGDPADCYKLVMTGAGALTLNLTGLTGDANLSLLDSKGKVLKSSTNKGNLSESIAGLYLSAGTYYVNVAPATNVNSATYLLTHTENYCPADKAANTWQTANAIATLDNWVGFGDAADCYKLVMTGAGALTLNLTGLTGDVNLSLLDSKGKVLKSSTNKGNLSESIANYALLGGTYYVNVAPATGVNKATYTLTHTENYCPTDKAANTWQTANAIATLDNWVGFGDAADCYKLTMTGNGILSLNMTGLTGDANLSLLDSKGKVLKTSANKANAAETITADLLAGTYYVNVAPATGVNNATYTLTHAEKYCPADAGGNSFDTASALSNGTVHEWLGFGDKEDYYKFEVTANDTTGTASLSGFTSDINLFVYNSNHKQVAASTKTGLTGEQVTGKLKIGTYYFKVMLAGTAATEYNLNFNLTPPAVAAGGLQLFSSASPLTGSSDAIGSSDPLKKNQGMLAS